MRSLPLLLLLAACPPPRELPEVQPPSWPETDTFAYEATLLGRVAGHAVGADALVVGVDGLTVLLRPSTVEVDSRVEAAPGVDEIVLAMDQATSGPVALVLTPRDVRVVVFSGGGIREPWPVEDVVDGDLVGESPVVLVRGEGGCAVHWVADEVEVGLGVDCLDGSTVSAVDGETVVVALGDGGVHRVDQAGATEIATLGQWADWDGTGRIYLAVADGIVVMDLEGAVERTITTERPPTAIVALGDRGVVWVEADGTRERIRWASPEGDDRGEVVHDEPIVAITASPDGRRLGVQRTLDVGTYAVGS